MRIKSLKRLEIGEGVWPRGGGRSFTKEWKFSIFLGPGSHSPAPIEVKFCTAKRTHVAVGLAKFHANWCNESPLRGPGE